MWAKTFYSKWTRVLLYFILSFLLCCSTLYYYIARGESKFNCHFVALFYDVMVSFSDSKTGFFLARFYYQFYTSSSYLRWLLLYSNMPYINPFLRGRAKLYHIFLKVFFFIQKARIYRIPVLSYHVKSIRTQISYSFICALLNLVFPSLRADQIRSNDNLTAQQK